MTCAFSRKVSARSCRWALPSADCLAAALDWYSVRNVIAMMAAAPHVAVTPMAG
jgi:hypothetical protein